MVFRKSDSGHVDVMNGAQPYRLEEVSLDKKEAIESWRRWTTNASRDGVANTWAELNTKTGSLRLIDLDNKVNLKGTFYRR